MATAPSGRQVWRTGLIAQLLGVTMSDLQVEPTVADVILFTSPAAFEERVRRTTELKSRAFGDAAEPSFNAVI